MNRLAVDLTDRSLVCALDDRTAWAAFARLLDAAAGLRTMYVEAGEPTGFPGVHSAMVGDDEPLADARLLLGIEAHGAQRKKPWRACARPISA